MSQIPEALRYLQVTWWTRDHVWNSALKQSVILNLNSLSKGFCEGAGEASSYFTVCLRKHKRASDLRRLVLNISTRKEPLLPRCSTLAQKFTTVPMRQAASKGSSPNHPRLSSLLHQQKMLELLHYPHVLRWPRWNCSCVFLRLWNLHFSHTRKKIDLLRVSKVTSHNFQCSAHCLQPSHIVY